MASTRCSTSPGQTGPRGTRPGNAIEDDLTEKIRVLAEQIQDMDRAIFNIHVPPYGTGLDTAPELEEGARVKRGGTITGPVGSTAVRDAILEYQPLLSLHGHIHESRGMHKLGPDAQHQSG